MASQSESSHHLFHWNYSELDDSNFQIHGSTLYSILVLVAGVFLVVVLFLYSREICRFASSRSRGLHAPPHQGLHPATISKLPVVKYMVSGDFTEAECCICLGIFGVKDQVKVLPNCGHCFHSDCVDTWLTGHSSCPLCRAPIRVDSPV